MNPSTHEKEDAPQRIWGRFSKKQTASIFGLLILIYALTAFERLGGPSEHLHYIDLASSFLEGRLDTDTPRKSCRKGKRPKDDGSGFQDFVCGHTRKDDGSWEGWNDWATYRSITLKDGTELKGVWPYGDTKGSDKNLFRTFSGDLYIVDAKKDLKKGCNPKRKRASCNEKKHFISFPPAPAVIMMPFVAVFNYRLNDVLWTLVFAAAGILALLALLERASSADWNARTKEENLWLIALFAFGTSFYFSSVRGEVWFTALVMGFFFNTLYLYFAVDSKKPYLAGLMLAIAMATRPPTAFGCVFFGLQLLRIPNRREQIIKGLQFSAPILCVGGLLMLYNSMRFESLTEFGHTFLQDGQRASIREHGLFSPWFLKGNLAAAFGNLPRITSDAPFVQVSRHGISIFAATPALLLLLSTLKRKETSSSAVYRLWFVLIPLICVATPALFYQNTGWAQYSYRFSVDYLPYLALLLGCSSLVQGRAFKTLVVISILISLFGAITFGRFEQFYFG